MRWWNTLPSFQLILTALFPCCMLQNHPSSDCGLQNIRTEFPNSKMSKIYNRNMDLFIFEHVQFPESEMSVIQKHRTYNLCNRKCHKIKRFWTLLNLQLLLVHLVCLLDGKTSLLFFNWMWLFLCCKKIVQCIGYAMPINKMLGISFLPNLKCSLWDGETPFLCFNWFLLPSCLVVCCKIIHLPIACCKT